jgi:CO dehydrogenase maturation factor
MKLAIAGKGGSGKTTIAGILARLVARRGVDVLAIDADLNPNLAHILGLAPGSTGEVVQLPLDLVRRRPLGGQGGQGGLELITPAEELVLDYGVDCADKVRLLSMAEPRQAATGCMCSSHETVRVLLRELTVAGRFVVADMEASPEHLTRATPEAAEVLLAVAEPYFRSLEAAGRQARLASDLGIKRIAVIANKVRDSRDEEAITAFCEHHHLELLGSVPYDTMLGEADRANMPPVDYDPGATSVVAVGRLADRLLGGLPR